MATASHPSDPDRVHAVATNRQAISGIEEVSTSWRRCLGEYGVDPGSGEPPRILTDHELKEISGSVEELVAAARDENDRLHAIVGKVGYGVFLASSDGVVVDYRGDPARADEFKHWGIWKGGVWSEQIEGTNGIGTCIAEQRAVTVHRVQHFRSRHTSLSCSGAPIFGPDGNLAAVLDVTSIDPDVSDRSHALALAMTIDSAHGVERSLFRRRFHREWILTLVPPATMNRGLMLAVDEDQRILGASRDARRALGLDDDLLATGASLWTFFARSVSHFRRNDDDATTPLTRIGENQPWQALITPPETRAANADQRLLHRQSRVGRLEHILREAANSQSLTELTPSVQRKVREFVEAHLDERISLETLAATAGLPVHDFTRAFTHSAGIPPQGYVLRRRIERAKEMSSMSGIAAALSPREGCILELIGQGQSNKEIARMLCITPETVKSHVKHLFAKLGVERRTQAVYRAQSLGLAATRQQASMRSAAAV
jgi:transcriptional regulator of acetoin/glycerol metabolism/DNA-binding CsgD family transcriptional regulator